MMRRLPGLLVVLAVTVAPAAAWPEDEAPSKEPATDSSPGLLESERSRLESRFYGATPEERERLTEERKRISAAAAGFGTDPTAIVGYYELTYGHNVFTNNLRLDGATAEVRMPVTPNWLVRVTLPYVWADSNQPRGSTANGTSDTLVRNGGRLYASPNVAVYVGLDALFPTAAKNELGTGKYTLGPGGAVAVPLPRARSLLFVLVQNFQSVGGDPSRNKVNFMQVQSAVNTIWSERWWSTASISWAADWTNNRKTTMNLAGEVGHRLDEHWNVFAGPGFGVVGKDTRLGLDWNVQAGVRWVFKTPLLPEKLFDLPLPIQK
jgi:hypothetical protein